MQIEIAYVHARAVRALLLGTFRAVLDRPTGADEVRRAFALLPLRDVGLGNCIVRKVPFVTPVNRLYSTPDREADGILTTVLFQRVYASNSGHFVIFDSK